MAGALHMTLIKLPDREVQIYSPLTTMAKGFISLWLNPQYCTAQIGGFLSEKIAADVWQSTWIEAKQDKENKNIRRSKIVDIIIATKSKLKGETNNVSHKNPHKTRNNWQVFLSNKVLRKKKKKHRESVDGSLARLRIIPLQGVEAALLQLTNDCLASKDSSAVSSGPVSKLMLSVVAWISISWVYETINNYL